MAKGAASRNSRASADLNLNPENGKLPKMKNRILQFCRARLIAAACLFSVAAALANSSLAAPAVPVPQNYSGTLTHGEFVSCGGQTLNPPAYSVHGTWVFHLDPMTQAQVPPPAHLTWSCSAMATITCS